MAVMARGAGFQARFMLSGVRYVEQFDSRPEAEAWEADCRKAHALGQPIPLAYQNAAASKAGNIESLVRHCWNMHWKDLKSGEHLVKNAELFSAWAGPKMPVDAVLTTEKIDEYVLFRQTEKSNSTGTINRHLSAISVLVEQAVRQKLLSAPIQLPWKKEGKHRIRFYTDEEEAEMFALLRKWEEHDYRDLFIFLVDTGFRLGEALKVPWKDINGRVIVLDPKIVKTDQERRVLASPRVLEVLTRQDVKGREGGPFHWVSKRRLRTIWDRLRANLEWMGDDTVIHTFRHTCATRLANDPSIPLKAVMDWMGHKNLTTTQRYVHTEEGTLEKIATALAKRGEPGFHVVAA